MNGPKVAKFLVGQVKCEPVPAYIGGARTATCGRARVVPREVVSREKLTPYRLRLNAKGCDRIRSDVSISQRRCSQDAGRTNGHLFVHFWIRRWRRLFHRLILSAQQAAQGLGGATK